MNSKLAMIIYIVFAILSFLFGVKMFQMGDILRGILFMVAVVCWAMCIYNNSSTKKRQNKRLEASLSSKNNKNNKKLKR